MSGLSAADAILQNVPAASAASFRDSIQTSICPDDSGDGITESLLVLLCVLLGLGLVANKRNKARRADSGGSLVAADGGTGDGVHAGSAMQLDLSDEEARLNAENPIEWDAGLATRCTKVRRTPRWPRSWANFSPL